MAQSSRNRQDSATEIDEKSRRKDSGDSDAHMTEWINFVRPSETAHVKCLI